MLYWRYWFSVTQTLNWNYICMSMTYISWSSDFALYLERFFFKDKCHNWNTGSTWCKDLPDKMYVSQGLTFHGPVILSYILKTVWWIKLYWRYWFNLTQAETIYVGQWHTFRGPVIWHILKTFSWRTVGLEILIPSDIKFDLQIYICRSVTYILLYSDSA